MKKLLVLLFFYFYSVIYLHCYSPGNDQLEKGLNQISEKVQTPLGPPLASGTYIIGTGGNFPTIDSVFNKLSIDGISGAVTFELIDNLYVAPLPNMDSF